MASYFAVFMPIREGGYSVEFPDIPEAFTQGDTLEECLVSGNDVLAIAAEEYAKAHKDMPEPSTLEQAEAWAEEQKGEPGIDASRRSLLQLFRVPAVDMAPAYA